MRLHISLLAATLILAVAPVALADSFQYTINSNVTEFITNTNNDSFMGIYSTALNPSSVITTTPYYGNTPFSNISFTLPSGRSITSAAMTLILPSTALHGDASLGIAESFSSPDPDDPIHIDPTLNPGISTVIVDGLLVDSIVPLYGYSDGGFTTFNLSSLLAVNGSSISSVDLDNIHLLVLGSISATINKPGHNVNVYIGGSGQASIPYELVVSGTYSPVPEPSGIVLLGTGLFGLAGFARRKAFSHP